MRLKSCVAIAGTHAHDHHDLVSHALLDAAISIPP